MTIKLENIDSEDMSDVLVKLEKSFQIKYKDIAFKEAKTFGDICDIIEEHINLPHQVDCTTQHAFYKVREALTQTVHLDKKQILPHTKLEHLFPRKVRIQKVKTFQGHLGLQIKILDMRQWLAWIIFLGFILSLIALFFDWRIAVSGLVFFYIFLTIASSFSKELELTTVRQLTEKITREYYFEVRRQKGTINKNEIFKVIQDTFSADLNLDKTLLTREASLGWR